MKLDVSRRIALKAMAAGYLTLTMPGCGHVGRVVVRLAVVISGVIRAAVAAAKIVVEFFTEDGQKGKLSAGIGPEQHAALKDGGELVIRDAEGKEFTVPFSLTTS